VLPASRPRWHQIVLGGTGIGNAMQVAFLTALLPRLYFPIGVLNP
jgi:hypothetical protein